MGRPVVIALLAAMLQSMPAAAAEPVSSTAMVAAHNQVRAGLKLPPLRWSDPLASDAARWADELALNRGCKMQHAGVEGQGENLFWASALLWSDGRREVQAVTPQKVVDAWASERRDYDYARNSCRAGKACGHYTQIVWKGTTEVGCAMSVCPEQGQIWVCRYQPPGNWVGERPY
jgi:pathogenesis-related protein 1